MLNLNFCYKINHNFTILNGRYCCIWDILSHLPHTTFVYEVIQSFCSFLMIFLFKKCGFKGTWNSKQKEFVRTCLMFHCIFTFSVLQRCYIISCNNIFKLKVLGIIIWCDIPEDSEFVALITKYYLVISNSCCKICFMFQVLCCYSETICLWRLG
jgi:hypothetical protein